MLTSTSTSLFALQPCATMGLPWGCEKSVTEPGYRNRSRNQSENSDQQIS